MSMHQRAEVNHIAGMPSLTTHVGDNLYISGQEPLLSGRVTARNRSTAMAVRLKTEQDSNTLPPYLHMYIYHVYFIFY